MNGEKETRGTFGSCNVAGFTKEKLAFFRTVLDGVDVVGLQETHGVQKDLRSRVSRLGFKEGIFSLHTRATRGSALLWKAPFEQQGEAWTDREGRIAAVILKSNEPNSPRILFASVYAPNVDPSPRTHAQYVSFLISLELMLTTMTDRGVDKTVMFGDFNLLCYAELDSLSASPKIFKIPLEGLQELLNKFDLYDAFRSINPVEKAYTFFRRGALRRDQTRAPPIMNRLDYAFVDAGTLSRIRNFEHRTVALTDHKMIWLCCQESPRKKLLGLWKHNDLLNRDTKFVKMMEDKLKEFIPLAEAECSTSRGAWEAIKGKIREWSRKFSIDKMKQEKREKNRLLLTLEEEDPTTEAHQGAKTELDRILRLEADRLIFRSKVKWVEENEKSTRFFT